MKTSGSSILERKKSSDESMKKNSRSCIKEYLSGYYGKKSSIEDDLEELFFLPKRIFSVS